MDTVTPLAPVSAVEEVVPGEARNLRSRAVSPDLAPGTYRAFLMCATLVGATFRLWPVFGASFPVGDGGMFYTMVGEIIRHNFLLPQATAYNGEHIPFDYPPVGLYVVAFLHGLLSVPLLTIFIYLPAVVSVLAILAFIALSTEVLDTRAAVIGAAFSFALLYGVFQWEIKGGGITRSPGLLFALLALWALLRALREPSKARAILAGVLFALTAMTHLEWMWFAGCSAVILVVGRGRSRPAFAAALGVAAVAILCVLPWAGLILARHGMAPILATFSGSEADTPWPWRLFDLATLQLTDEPYFSLAEAIGLAGTIVCLLRREWLLPSWLALTVLLTSRSPVDKASIVLALLCGVGVRVLVRASRDAGMPPPSRRRHGPMPLVCALIVLLVGINTAAAGAVGNVRIPPATLHSLAWLTRNTPPHAAVIVPSTSLWGENYVAEWLPALTGRRSLTAVQGTEWLPGVFAKRLRAYTALSHCSTAQCLGQWQHRYHEQGRFVLIPRSGSEHHAFACCRALAKSLAATRGITTVYRGTGALLFRLNPGWDTTR